MNRKPLIKWRIFQVGAWTNLKYFMRNHLFPKKCTVHGIRESQIAQNNQRNRMLHALYIWIENLSYNEEYFKLGHAPTWNISWKNHLFPKKQKCTFQSIRESQIAQKSWRYRTVYVLYIWIDNFSYIKESFNLGHAPTWNISCKIHLCPKNVP